MKVDSNPYTVDRHHPGGWQPVKVKLERLATLVGNIADVVFGLGSITSISVSEEDVHFIPFVNSVAELFAAYDIYQMEKTLSVGQKAEFDTHNEYADRLISVAVRVLVLGFVYLNAGKRALLKALVLDLVMSVGSTALGLDPQVPGDVGLLDMYSDKRRGYAIVPPCIEIGSAPSSSKPELFSFAGLHFSLGGAIPVGNLKGSCAEPELDEGMMGVLSTLIDSTLVRYMDLVGMKLTDDDKRNMAPEVLDYIEQAACRLYGSKDVVKGPGDETEKQSVDVTLNSDGVFSMMKEAGLESEYRAVLAQLMGRYPDLERTTEFNQLDLMALMEQIEPTKNKLARVLVTGLTGMDLSKASAAQPFVEAAMKQVALNFPGMVPEDALAQGIEQVTRELSDEMLLPFLNKVLAAGVATEVALTTGLMLPVLQWVGEFLSNKVGVVVQDLKQILVDPTNSEALATLKQAQAFVKGMNLSRVVELSEMFSLDKALANRNDLLAQFNSGDDGLRARHRDEVPFLEMGQVGVISEREENERSDERGCVKTTVTEKHEAENGDKGRSLENRIETDDFKWQMVQRMLQTAEGSHSETKVSASLSVVKAAKVALERLGPAGEGASGAAASVDVLSLLPPVTGNAKASTGVSAAGAYLEGKVRVGFGPVSISGDVHLEQDGGGYDHAIENTPLGKALACPTRETLSVLTPQDLVGFRARAGLELDIGVVRMRGQLDAQTGDKFTVVNARIGGGATAPASFSGLRGAVKIDNETGLVAGVGVEMRAGAHVVQVLAGKREPPKLNLEGELFERLAVIQKTFTPILVDACDAFAPGGNFKDGDGDARQALQHLIPRLEELQHTLKKEPAIEALLKDVTRQTGIASSSGMKSIMDVLEDHGVKLEAGKETQASDIKYTRSSMPLSELFGALAETYDETRELKYLELLRLIQKAIVVNGTEQEVSITEESGSVVRVQLPRRWTLAERVWYEKRLKETTNYNVQVRNRETELTRVVLGG